MTIHMERSARRAASHLRRAGLAADKGMSTAEYAVGTIAACALGGVLYTLVKSGPIQDALQQLLEQALRAPV